MKKTLLALTIATALSSSIALAAPITDLQKGNSAAGYLYWNAGTTVNGIDFGSNGANGAYVETAVGDNFVLGIETISGNASKTIGGVTGKIDIRFTDLTMQYKIDNNFRVIVGNRNYDGTVSSTNGYHASTSENKFVYGLAASAPLSETTSTYATYLHDSYANEWQIGVNQNIGKNMLLNVNYRSHKEDSAELKGIGAGLVVKF